jgi:hypothetical protein
MRSAYNQGDERHALETMMRFLLACACVLNLGLTSETFDASVPPEYVRLNQPTSDIDVTAVMNTSSLARPGCYMLLRTAIAARRGGAPLLRRPVRLLCVCSNAATGGVPESIADTIAKVGCLVRLMQSRR